MGALRYADALAEAKAEYEAWLERPSLIILPLGFHGDGIVWAKRGKPGARTRRCECGERATRADRCDKCAAEERAERREACACGGGCFARGLCRSCYYREYNRGRDRTPRRRLTTTERAELPQCKCGRGPAIARGICRRCYDAELYERRRERQNEKRRLERAA